MQVMGKCAAATGIVLLLLTAVHAADTGDELLRLGREVNRFERELPFFTKSKLTIFFGFDRKQYEGTFYGLYLNDNLVRTGVIRTGDALPGRNFFVGDFPVRAGQCKVTIRLSRETTDTTKKFQVDVPEFRRVAAEFLIADEPEKPRIVPRAWVVE